MSGFAPGEDSFFASQLLKESMDVIGILDPLDEFQEDLAIDQMGGSDRHSREQLEQFAGATGQELEEPLQIPAVIVGSEPSWRPPGEAGADGGAK